MCFLKANPAYPSMLLRPISSMYHGRDLRLVLSGQQAYTRQAPSTKSKGSLLVSTFCCHLNPLSPFLWNECGGCAPDGCGHTEWRCRGMKNVLEPAMGCVSRVVDDKQWCHEARVLK
ncbi:hypothetical protein BC938DRAFT_476123 [Jimgerdemannia flammicorona]|uniref:Uncharacterized protein n=1 Tax=Jimgerdemannia flammicorona TaxID=994334 RepID=A0A433QQV4_9FUNG|nr:hypothetical protein BC938DRAFT_476123 [Jimgerdemannia flammicorona]